MTMLRILNIVILCLTYNVMCSVTVVAQTSSHGGVDDTPDLRSMLMTVREQNRRLVLQNQRLQQVWLGMQQMCNALDMETFECEGTDKNMGKKEEIKKDTEQMQENIQKHTDQIQVVFVESSGVDTDGGNITLRVGYTAPRPHTHEWVYSRNRMLNLFSTRTFGRNVTDVNGHHYSFEITVESPETLQYIAFRVYTEYEYLELGFNQTVMETQLTQYLLEKTPTYLNIDTVFQAPQDTDLNITTNINETQTVLERDTANFFMFFQFINSTTDPPIILETFVRTPEVEQKQPDKSVTITITVPHPEVQYGGRLAIYYQYMPLSTGLIAQYMYGVVANILPYESKTVFPENTVAVHPLRKQFLIDDMRQSLYCSAMGNPRPHVSLMKVSKAGKTKVLESESVFVNSVTQVTSYTFKHDGMKNNVEGRYLCRTTGANRTIDQETELVYLHPAVFDESKTGILKNTTKAVVISCKASGKPRPELQLHLYDESGPDLLIPSTLYKVKTKNNKKASRASLTLVPNEDLPLSSFHTIICIAVQGEGPWPAVRTSRTIEMFPYSNNTYIDWDWALVDRINQDQGYLNLQIG